MICHLAARAGVRASIEEPLLYAHSNVVGTVTMLGVRKEGEREREREREREMAFVSSYLCFLIDIVLTDELFLPPFLSSFIQKWRKSLK